MQKIITNSEKETIDFAKEFVPTLKGGEVLALIGDLGAGKTAFTKGLAQALGVEKTITSPTFVLMKPYQADYKNINNVIHIDAYRLNTKEDMEAIGADEYFGDPSSITIIEWADRVKDILPKDAVILEFTIGKGDHREIEIK